ncbi:MAG: alpha-amylase family glycosyl hydrolase [Saprospiraceae bacterium]|nr:hypothetical protein [Lewinella sp.]
MLQRLISLALLVLVARVLSGQIITVDPAFPTATDQITIYFDATKGTAGLKDCNCDVYLHTGVITNQSTGSSDWRYVQTTWGQANSAWKMSPVSGQANQYSYVIGSSIREYYQVPAGEAIEQLAFVFRNADGSKEGKDTGGADIFYEVYDASLQIALTSPAQNPFFVDQGANVVVEAQSNKAATLSIWQDGILEKEVSNTTNISNTFVADNGIHIVEVRAVAGNETASQTLVYLTSDAQSPTPPPADYPDGLSRINESAAFFQLHAPTNELAFLIGDFNDWQISADYLMHRSEDGTFWLEVDGLTPGQTYTYQYLVDEGIRIADPLSTLVLDPEHDQYIPEVTFPDLPDYPVGNTQGIVSVFKWGSPDYNWQIGDFQAPPREELVVYELLLRDFLARHDYQTLKDTLDYLQRLGINAIELMPISEFEGNISWGYNPSFHMALDKYYGTPEAFKSLIDECHRRGIAVILDVVYNHAFSQSPLARLDWDAAAFKPSPTNPWLNVEATHPFNVGYDFNHESPDTRRYIDRVMQYWLEEFRVDGFRFDLSKGFTQRRTTDVGFWGSYEPNRIATLKHYADVMWSVNPDAYVILEHFADNLEEVELINYGMMSWAGAGVHNAYLEGSMGYATDLKGASYKYRNWPLPHLMAYMESHDEERMVYKNKTFGNSLGNYNVKNYPTSIRRAELAAAFFYTIPGPKMLWQFGELGYDYSINTCEDGTIGDCRLSPKPIRWDFLDDPARNRLFDVVSGLIYLKTNYDVFNTTDFTLDVSSNTPAKKIFLNNAEMDVVIQGNFDVSDQTLSNAFSHTGWWYDYFTGDSILVENAGMSVSLAPGAYHVYTSVALNEPPNGFPTKVNTLVKDHFQIRISPNPVSSHFRIAYHMPEAAQVQLDLIDRSGRLVQTLHQEWLPAGEGQMPVSVDLPAGIYHLRFTAGGKMEMLSLVIQ